jgi:hypothetical protein
LKTPEEIEKLQLEKEDPLIKTVLRRVEEHLKDTFCLDVWTEIKVEGYASDASLSKIKQKLEEAKWEYYVFNFQDSNFHYEHFVCVRVRKKQPPKKPFRWPWQIEKRETELTPA